MAKIPFGTNEIWNQCNNFDVNEDANDEITVRGWPRWRVCLYDSSEGISERRSQAFVLFSPDLSNQFISRLLTVRKKNELPSGFRLSDAIEYDRVFVVDPDGEFSDAELAPLVQAGADVVRLAGNTAQEMSDSLASSLP